ncbi:MAG TPA: hypothetical protein VLH13_04110 [Methanomassiliicoccales archaeon]|nr:hypothetical protein [Methanomassiliicoccales archaeon]
MIEKKSSTKIDAGAKPAAKAAGSRVTRSTPIKVRTRDASTREVGIKILSRFHMGEMDLEMIIRRALRYENRKIGDEEAVMALLTELMRNADNPQMKAKMMEAIAEFQSIIGIDPRPVLAEMHKMELNIFKDLGFEKVTITCKKDACPVCRRQDGANITIEEAQAIMPLPHPACIKLPHPKAKAFCRCHYLGEYIS